jgi:hypothetical protein
MPKKVSFTSLSLQAQLDRALPVARQAIREGLDISQRLDTENSILDRVSRLTGDRSLGENLSDSSYSQLWDRLEAAQALGIAFGLLLNRDAFVNDSRAR